MAATKKAGAKAPAATKKKAGAKAPAVIPTERAHRKIKALPKHDLNALETAMWASLVRNTEEPEAAAEMQWAVEYPRAISAALDKRDFKQLLALLRDRRPLPPLLLPALADAIEARGRNSPSGQKRLFSAVEARLIADRVQYLRRLGKSATEANEEVADAIKVSVSSVKRAYEAIVPAYRRPALIRSRL